MKKCYACDDQRCIKHLNVIPYKIEYIITGYQLVWVQLNITLPSYYCNML